jgi:hypothetical protein
MRWPLITLLVAAAAIPAVSHLPAQDLRVGVPLDSGRLVRLRLDDGTVVRGRLFTPLSSASTEVTFCRYPAPPCRVIGWMLLGAVQFGAWGALFGSSGVVWGPAS